MRVYEQKAEKPPVKRVLGIFSLAMINVAAILSIRYFPSMAIYGWSCIGWYLIGTVLFFIPITLTSAELATGWPQEGGVYTWVKQAFGEKYGFIAIFCGWSNNLVWFPTVLSFIFSTLIFTFTPDLASSSWYMFTVMMIAFWGTTAVALLGEDFSAKCGNVGAVLGSIIPAVVIIVLGMLWVETGASLAIPQFTVASMIPQISLNTLPFFATVILLFAGMEITGYHAREVKNPQTGFPKAMGISILVILFTTVIGTLAISFAVPVENLNLASGVMQAFQYFFSTAGLSWLIGPMALLISIGGFAQLACWLIGPAKGLRAVAEEGNLPQVFNFTNKYGAPVGVLIIQALIGSVISLLYIFMPTINQAYWILTAMTVELLCIVYVLMFASLIKLRYCQPDTPRPYKIPGGKACAWLVGGLGISGIIFAFIVGLIPPDYYANAAEYVGIMLLGTIMLAAPPLVFMKIKKPFWMPEARNSIQGEEP